MGFENLTHVHTARHAQWVKHDLNRSAVFEERHVLDRQNLRNHTLVTVTASHLVTDGNHPLGGDINFDHLQHATAKLVAALHRVELAIANVDGFVHRRPHRLVNLLDILEFLRAIDGNRIQTESRGQIGDELRLLIVNLLVAILVGDLLAQNLFDFDDHLGELDGNRFVAFLFRGFERLLEQLAFVLRQAHAPRKLLRVDHDTFDARGNFQRIVLHVFTGTAEDRVE